MGRLHKKVIDENGGDRREIGYYSTPFFVSEYITKQLLKINPNGHKVFGPAVGKEELLKTFYLNDKSIDSIDINAR